MTARRPPGTRTRGISSEGGPLSAMCSRTSNTLTALVRMVGQRKILQHRKPLAHAGATQPGQPHLPVRPRPSLRQVSGGAQRLRRCQARPRSNREGVPSPTASQQPTGSVRRTKRSRPRWRRAVQGTRLGSRHSHPLHEQSKARGFTPRPHHAPANRGQRWRKPRRHSRYESPLARDNDTHQNDHGPQHF